jgi:hypothetical protein
MAARVAALVSAERRVVYFPPSPRDPYLAVVLGPAGEVVRVTAAPNWREAEKALREEGRHG